METHKKQSNERLTWVTSLSVTLFVEIGKVSVARPDFFPRLLEATFFQDDSLCNQ